MLKIPNYPTELNIVIASKGISSATETLYKTVISSQGKLKLQTKIVFQFLFHQLIQFKIFQIKFLWRHND